MKHVSYKDFTQVKLHPAQTSSNRTDINKIVVQNCLKGVTIIPWQTLTHWATDWLTQQQL